MKVRVLGCSGAIAKDCKTTSFLINQSILIDAGTGVGDLTLEEMQAIDHVFLTHSHLDHIAALPLMLDAIGAKRTKPITVYGLVQTLEALKAHVFNDIIWPDFSRIPSVETPFLRLAPIETGQQIPIAEAQVEALPAQHSVPAVGYSVSEQGPSWVFSGDTTTNPAFWQKINALSVGMLVIETAFSNKEMKLAELSCHLAPTQLAEQLKQLDRDKRFPIYITHTKPAETETIMQEIETLCKTEIHLNSLAYPIYKLSAGQEFIL